MEFTITSKKYGTHTILLDEEDRELLTQKWYLSFHKNGTPKYVMASGKPTKYLHREIMRPPEGYEIDHINGNKLDNRRSNLRICKRRDNLRNRSPFSASSNYKGVEKGKGASWRAVLTYDGIFIYTKSFDTEVEAAKTYDKLASKLYGQFAKLNFPEENT